jgi:hypothetical protein
MLTVLTQNNRIGAHKPVCPASDLFRPQLSHNLDKGCCRDQDLYIICGFVTLFGAARNVVGIIIGIISEKLIIAYYAASSIG